MPLGPDFLPQFEAISEADAQRARVMLLNYPNNPTCAVAGPDFFAAAVAFCRRHGLLLIHDNPYVDYVYGAATAASPLAVEGAKDVTIELFSFAKSFHLGGFRLGFALGNAGAIAALEATKAAVDFNQYLGIQRMGVACLQLPEERLRADAKVRLRTSLRVA
jgi:aspartate/methionine/tyrosine aminotransferase